MSDRAIAREHKFRPTHMCHNLGCLEQRFHKDFRPWRHSRDGGDEATLPSANQDREYKPLVAQSLKQSRVPIGIRVQDEIEDLGSHRWGTLSVGVLRLRAARARRSASSFGGEPTCDGIKRTRRRHPRDVSSWSRENIFRTNSWLAFVAPRRLITAVATWITWLTNQQVLKCSSDRT